MKLIINATKKSNDSVYIYLTKFKKGSIHNIIEYDLSWGFHDKK